MSLLCVMLSMSQQWNLHALAHHMFVDMYVWNVHSVHAVVRKSAQNTNHSPQLHLKPCMFDLFLAVQHCKELAVVSKSAKIFKKIISVFVIMYDGNVLAVLVVVSEPAEKSKHSSWSSIKHQPTFDYIRTLFANVVDLLLISEGES